MGNVTVGEYSGLKDAVREKNIVVGVLAVLAASAQTAANDLVDAGVRSLLQLPGGAARRLPTSPSTSNPAVELLYALYFHLT